METLTNDQRAILRCVRDQLLHINWKWGLWKASYMRSIDNIEICNNEFPEFLGTAQVAIRDSVIVDLIALSGNSSGDITLRSLFKTLGINPDDDIAELLDVFDSLCTNIKTHRNKRIAHLDRAIEIGKRNLATFTDKDFSIAVECACNIYKIAERRIGETNYSLEWHGQELAAADAVVNSASSSMKWRILSDKLFYSQTNIHSLSHAELINLLLDEFDIDWIQRIKNETSTKG